MTLRHAIQQAEASITRRDAETLLLHILRRERAWLFAHDAEPLAESDAALFNTLITRRAAYEPLQYITGTQEFYGLALRVTPAALIPRPETEHLVEAVELCVTQFHDNRILRVLDVGTGTGAIAIALATHLAGVDITAVDLSEAALTLARENAANHNCADRIRFLRSDLLDTLQGERFDIIVSNPPYVPTADAATMQPEVVHHEPHLALFAGDDGMAVYRRLIPAAHSALNPGGLLAMEFGYNQREALQALLTNPSNHWYDIHYIPDLQGIDRVVTTIRNQT